MNNLEGNVLVPYDFSHVAKNAVAHSLIISTHLNVGITLLHIIDKVKQQDEFEAKLEEDAKELSKLHGKEISYIVRQGSIFRTIKRVATEMSSALIVMGTHGLKGIQKLTGSRALKVIAGSRIPFLVVQDAPKEGLEYNKLVFPVDFKRENKEKLKWVDFMFEYFKSKIFLITNTSKGIIEKRTQANLSFSTTFLEQRGIDYELITLDTKKDFSQGTIDFTKERDADLIIIMTTRDLSFQNYIVGPQEQYMIANEEKIPVLVINPRTDLVRYGYSNL